MAGKPRLQTLRGDYARLGVSNWQCSDSGRQEDADQAPRARAHRRRLRVRRPDGGVGRVSVDPRARVMYGAVLDSEASKVEVGESAP
jgi:hypothetical protein